MNASKKFWSCVLTSSTPTVINVPEDSILVISNACLFEFPEGQPPAPSRVYSCQATEGQEKTDTFLAVLVPKIREHTVLSYKLQPGATTTLGVYGAATVHLTGYYINMTEDSDYTEEEDNEIPMPNPSEII